MAQAWILFHKNKKDTDIKQKLTALLDQREDLFKENEHLKLELTEYEKKEEWLKNKLKDDYRKWSSLSKELIDMASSILNRSKINTNNYESDSYYKSVTEELNRYR